MKSILSKIYKFDSKQASQDIYDLYQSNWQAIVNYIYGANIIKNDLFENQTSKPLKQVLLDGDFLLPDGAALLTFWRFGGIIGGLSRLWIFWPKALSNINWTDFLPFMIHEYISKVGKDNVKLVIYGSRKEFQPKIRQFIDDNFGIELLYILDGYSDFDWNKLDNIKNSNKSSEKSSDKILWNSSDIYIFIVARGTPLQETWTAANRDNLSWFIVMNQWGTMDFWAWFETRAPSWIRALRLESIYRLITAPKKNFTKFMVSFAMIWMIVKKWILRR
jgi:exopolysaccharide biosynthesis WecB/TagA/CpsF family protein